MMTFHAAVGKLTWHGSSGRESHRVSGRPDVDLPVVCIDTPVAACFAGENTESGVDPNVQFNRIIESLVVLVLLPN